jgi:methylmalonyl-CoA mutase
MIGLKNDFPTSSLSEWKIQLEKELKGADFSVLERNDLIEEIHYSTFHHAESSTILDQTPGAIPFSRGYQTTSNEWNIGQEIILSDAKKANTLALNLLMKGCNYLRFSLNDSVLNSLTIAFEGIQFEYITTCFSIQTIEQFKAVDAYFNHSIPKTIRFAVDPHTVSKECFEYIAEKAKKNQFIFCHINGFAVQQIGATTWQEIAFCIAQGHASLVQLFNLGFTIDEASACLQFSVGIGSNYFFEISKIRAFRSVWSKIIAAYQPAHTCTYNTEILAEIGHTNKSLKDPYTNFLRQTTEIMAASSAGISTIIAHPYDSIAKTKTALAERMAINVSLIIKEESYFDAVIDPTGGSYSIEFITTEIGKKAWQLFQEIEALNGIETTEATAFIRSKIEEKAALRIQLLKDQKATLIGINKFHNGIEEENTIVSQQSYLGLPFLHFESLLTN